MWRVRLKKSMIGITIDQRQLISYRSSTPRPQAVFTAKKDQCIDPYRRPGYLFIDPEGDYNQTRYIPFTRDFLDAPDPPSAAYPYDNELDGELWFDEDSRPDDDTLDHYLTPQQWMNTAIEEATRRNQGLSKHGKGQLSWLQDRFVLFISDSIDRYNVQHFCGEFSKRAGEKTKFRDGKLPHTTSSCFIPSFNLTLLHWHLAGMPTYSPKWFPSKYKIVPFEQRWEDLWIKTLDTVNKTDHRPDLIIWQSALWDNKNFKLFAVENYGINSTMAKWTRRSVWDEIQFYTARAQKLMRFIREIYGDVPMMLRTVTLNRSRMSKDVQSYVLDGINRAVAEKFDVEVFEWAKIIAGHGNLYQDELHPGKGPSSWLWANMLLEYLARAVGAGTKGGAPKKRAPFFDGWDRCHAHLV